jgi:hypothetical protein
MVRSGSFLASVVVGILAAFLTGCGNGNAQATYDIVILNGRVMDPETNFDGIRNVAISDGRIVSLTVGDIAGAETIDATGLVVAPGFIDDQQHGLENYGHRLMVRDGRTTIMDLELGGAPQTIGEFYEKFEGNSAINYGIAASHELARATILDGFTDFEHYTALDALEARKNSGWSVTRPSLEQGNQILALLDEGLRQGAIGIGSTVGYMRDGVSSREMFEVQKLGGAYGRQTGVHLRMTPGNDVGEALGVQELLANAAALGAPALVFHFNNPGYNVVQELLVRMRDRGHNVWGELYPYTAGSTAINAVFLDPEVWVDTLGNRYEETLQDIETGEFYTEESRAEMIKKEPTRIIIVHKMPQEALVDWLRMPGVAIGSDGMFLLPYTGLKWDTPYAELPNVHPRFAGSFARALRISRENNIPLMQTIAMTSYNTAKPLGDTGLKAMQVRGRMQEGMVADITIFDPNAVTDNADYANGRAPSSGIPHVIVNGIIVMRDSEPLPRFDAGQPIRFEVQQEGRFEPLSQDGWVKEFYVTPDDNDDYGAGFDSSN